MDSLSKIGVLPKHEKNLRTLADHLAKLPTEYESFSMMNYVFQQSADDASPSELLKIPCGAVACSVGHGPSAGILVGDAESWYDYIKNNLCIPKTPACSWMFSSKWSYVDNSPHGAAKRINYLLNEGLPADYLAIQEGVKPYPWVKS